MSGRPRRRLPIVLLAGTATVGLLAAACSGSSTEGARSIAENVDIGGSRSIYVECHGKGSPTVLLLSGGGTATDLWHAPDQDPPNVYDTIGAQTRVCAWDRPGVQYLDGSPSRSTPVAQPITPQDGARDIQAVLDALHMQGPYVLAAHSFAGNIARVFAAEHPADVRGIVFVDVLSPELRAQMTPQEWRTWVKANNRTPAQIAAYPDLEQYDFDASLDQVEAAESADPPRPMPVVVLTASVRFAELVPDYLDQGLLPPDVPRNFGEVIDRTNTAAQNELAGYFPGSVHITDTHAGHNIMIDNAPVAIKAIEDVLTAVRAGRSTLTGGDNHLAQAVEVDGRTLYLECMGTGSPTVTLQSGYGNAGDIWSLTDTPSPAVFPALAQTNRVCIYDRPGSMITTTNASGTVTLGETARRGRSDSAPMPRDPADVVTELHDLFAAADVPGPYVLVGHSLGGALDLLYARTYPDEVGALVTVDSPLPPWREILGPEISEKVRVSGLDPSQVPGYQLESYDLGTLFDEIGAAGPLPDIPVVVVRRGGPKLSDDPIPEGAPFTQAEVDEINVAQWDGQAQWAAGVPGAEVITVPGTTHYVHNQRPDAVVEAIRQAIARR
ncbi:MAG: alpha/beta hydrolase [Pseudonocardia sp.]|nr:alpha/beta hydrolase [Pseudonocardia sp.]